MCLKSFEVNHTSMIMLLMLLSEIFWAQGNRPFPSSPQPAFKSEAMCEVFVISNQFLFILKLERITIKLELITITKSYYNKFCT